MIIQWLKIVTKKRIYEILYAKRIDPLRTIYRPWHTIEKDTYNFGGKMVKRFLFLGLMMACDGKAMNTPTFLYSHGLFDNHTQAYWFTKNTPQGIENKRYFMEGEIVTFDYEDVTPGFWKTDFTQVSMAQTNEIMRLKKIYDLTRARLEEEQKNQNIILVGLSRGASTIINFAALFNPPQVKAIILEAPFDSSVTIAKSMVQNLKLHWIPGMQSMGHNLLSLLFTQHKKDGIQPIDAAADIKKDMPLFLACSLTDWLVPASSTMALYKKLVETGHTQVYLFIANKSKHSKIIFSDDGERYMQAINAFFKKYNLPHNETLAQIGQSILAECQPTISSLQKYLN